MAPARSLCPVHWRLGQALLPEHFERQQHAARAELQLRGAVLAPAGWGVAQIAWDDDALAAGLVRLTRLSAILARGRLVDLPGNARTAPLDVGVADRRQVDLYLHLLDEPSHEREDERAGDLEAVELVVDRLALSTQAGHPGAIDSLKLAELEQRPDATWIVRAEYAPPLVSLAAWPALFTAVTGRVRKILAAWQSLLLADLGSHVLSLGKTLRAHECLRRSRRHAAFLAQLAVLAAHPIALFEHLLDLYLDVHAYQSPPADEPALAAHVYDHRDPVASFEPLLAELDSRTRLPHGHVPYAPFARTGRIASVALPDRLAGMRLYWLVRRADTTAGDPRAIKLAAPSRLDTVHRHALRGVAAKPLASVPFRHDFDPDVAFYEIVTEGEEWEFAVRERALDYVVKDATTTFESYLFWQAM